MDIYRIAPDTNYQLMFPEDDVHDSDSWEFKGEPLITELPKLFKAHFAADSDKPYPDIALIGMSAFAFSDDAAKQLLDILEPAGELIPFYVDE